MDNIINIFTLLIGDDSDMGAFSIEKRNKDFLIFICEI